MTDATQDRDLGVRSCRRMMSRLLRELTERARAGGSKLAGEGGLLGKLAKMVVEGALEREMDDHTAAWLGPPAGAWAAKESPPVHGRLHRPAERERQDYPNGLLPSD